MGFHWATFPQSSAPLRWKALNVWGLKDVQQAPETRMEKCLYQAYLNHFSGRKQQKGGPNNSGTAHRASRDDYGKNLSVSLGSPAHTRASTWVPDVRAHVCVPLLIHLGLKTKAWLLIMERRQIHYKVQDKKFQSWSVKRRRFFAPCFPFILSSGPLGHLVTTAVSGLYPHSVLVICLDTAFLRIWRRLKHQKEETIWEVQ